MTRNQRGTLKFPYGRSIMAYRDSRSFVRICACLTTFVVAVLAVDQEKCDKTKCPGPLAYYEALDCKPVYEKEGDCCAVRYDCTHMEARSKNKCYVNGKEYELFEALKDEDANPCDIGCVCIAKSDGVASFVCAEVDCFFGPSMYGKRFCYRKNSPSECCPGEEVCLENPEDRATCNVSGKIYRDGEYFTVENEPDLNCVCQPGYKGENIEPFCTRPKHMYCSPDFRDAGSVHSKCAPVYYDNQSPQTDCNLFSRCQNDNDTVIRKQDDSRSNEKAEEEDVCLFGNMTMHRGDELNQATYYSSVCVKCICEVPPVPTCQRLPQKECDVEKHPPFNN